MTALSTDVLETLLGDRFDDRARALLELIQRSDEPEETADTGLMNDRSQRSERARRLKQAFQDMALELEDLRHRNGALADALGACVGCWGEQSDCPLCGGRGSPGSYPVDRELFEAIVMPAMSQVEEGASEMPASYKRGSDHG